MTKALVTLSSKRLLMVEELVTRLQNGKGDAMEVRAALRTIGFSIEKLKGRGAPGYDLARLQRDLDRGRIKIKLRT